MSQSHHRWAEELQDSVEVVRTMRDELKVQMHLAGLEIQEQFQSLEQRLEREQAQARHTFKEMIDGFREVKAALRAQKQRNSEAAKHP